MVCGAVIGPPTLSAATKAGPKPTQTPPLARLLPGGPGWAWPGQEYINPPIPQPPVS